MTCGIWNEWRGTKVRRNRFVPLSHRTTARSTFEPASNLVNGRTSSPARLFEPRQRHQVGINMPLVVPSFSFSQFFVSFPRSHERTPRSSFVYSPLIPLNASRSKSFEESCPPSLFTSLSTRGCSVAVGFASFSVLRTCPEPYVTRSTPELLIISIYIGCVVSRSQSGKQCQGPATLYGSSRVPFFSLLCGPVIVVPSLSLFLSLSLSLSLSSRSSDSRVRRWKRKKRKKHALHRNT